MGVLFDFPYGPYAKQPFFWTSQGRTWTATPIPGKGKGAGGQPGGERKHNPLIAHVYALLMAEERRRGLLAKQKLEARQQLARITRERDFDKEQKLIHERQQRIMNATTILLAEV